MTDVSTIGSFVIGGTQVLTFLLLWKRMSGIEKREITPQPLEVRAAAQHAPADHQHPQYQLWEKCREQHQQMLQEARTEAQLTAERVTQSRSEALRQEIKQDVKGIHSRIDAILRMLAGALKVPVPPESEG